MGSFDPTFVQELKQESWALYSVGAFLILFRFYARATRLGGYGKFQLDDWLMHLVLALYTTLIVCLNVTAGGGGSNLYDPNEEGPGSPHPFTEEETKERIYGSKIVVVSEQAMLNTIYVIKVCVLMMYTRITLGHATQKFVRYLAVYVVLGWLATEITFFAACRPFNGYWGMPPPNPQCTTYEHYAMVQACFNISSDLLMLGIPLPLVFKLQMPWKRKIVLVFIFSMGIFVIVAALLTKIFNLSDVWSTRYMFWYIRESSVAVYVSNLPMIWPLLREWFPVLRALNPAGQTGSTDLRRPTNITHLGDKAESLPSSTGDKFPSRYRKRDASLGSMESTIGLDIALQEQRAAESKTSSMEEIVAKPDRTAVKGRSGPSTSFMGGIQVETEVRVVQEDSARRDTATGGFDWDGAGRSKYQTTIS